ncbi:threonine synthase [Clostridium sp.]|uniref:threonine synthase n=1 Tax=Clostridium sp. TaxID=1506 RepID=UPI001A416AA1|nr:threonine synthase [Clostridium sp.]MBK5242268.1 threonine synthase [Clostridium sp.]
MNLMYKSTRGSSELITASEAIIKGMAEDGGLYIPVKIPRINTPLHKIMDFSYCKLANYILKEFLTDFSEDEISDCVKKAYSNNFSSEEIVEVKKEGDEFFLELYHGPTLAFKDMALSLLPHLLKTALNKHKITKEIVILTATSGDTGKAALEGFKNIDKTKIIVFYPEKGVSEIQKRQMTTQEGNNVYVTSIEGNFDDAQSGVKEIFNDSKYSEFLDKHNYILSSANSINIGRLVPQIVYYFYTYLSLLKKGEIKNNEKINIVVPTGNFGNILAAYYASEMGLPVNKFICASNENNVLSDFIKTGVYDTHRKFMITASPSMDILVSSNLERLNYYLSGRDEEVISKLMKKLSLDGKYEITQGMKNGLKDFHAGFSTDKDTFKSIKEVYDKFNYVMDTHTAVAYSVYKKYKMETDDNTKTIIVSTASPFKFTRSVCNSISVDTESFDDFELINELSKNTGLKVPSSIKDLKNKEIIYKNVCIKENMKNVINDFLKV